MTKRKNPPVLTSVAVHILLALADGDRYGLEIVEEVETRTGGEVKLGPGTLYGAIKRLRTTGLIRETIPPTEGVADSRLRIYQITSSGKLVLQQEMKRLASMVSTARKKAVLGPEELE